MSEESTLAVRCYPVGGQAPRKTPAAEPIHWPQRLLVIDTETSAEATRTMPGFEKPAWGAMQQSLLFGRCQVWERADDTAQARLAGKTPGHYYPTQEILFYPDNLPPEGVRRIQRYVETHSKPLGDHREYDTPCTVDGCACWPALYVLPLSEFLAVFYKLACEANRQRQRRGRPAQLNSLIVGANLPFDLSRLAWRASSARSRGYTNGFSFTLWTYTRDGRTFADTFRPHLCTRHIARHKTLCKWTKHKVRAADGRMLTVSYPANFLDIFTLAAALTGQAHDLDTLGLDYAGEGKAAITSHGLLTDEYVDYNRQDLRLTGIIANALFDRWREYFPSEDGLPPWRLFSPASVAKGYLRCMGVQPRLAEQPEFSASVLGKAMASYYGGRVECKIRKRAVPVVYLDMASMYPLVNALLGLWSFITAASVRVEEGPDVTGEVQALLNTISLDVCFDRDRWPGFTMLAAVAADGDILPSRVCYPEGVRIGVNPLYLPRGQTLWYALPDLIAAKLLTGRAPKIVRALRLQAVGHQETLQPCTMVGGFAIDPARDDFFRLLVEERQRVRAGAGNLNSVQRDQIQTALKLVANSGSYGIFAEMHRTDLEQITPVTFYSERKHVSETLAIDEPGAYFFSPLASLICSGARLLLAMLETCVHNAGGEYAACDTDSMLVVSLPERQALSVPATDEDGRHIPAQAVTALSWAEVEGIRQRFQALSPFADGRIPTLKVEKENFDDDKRQRVIWYFGISSKRYCLGTKEMPRSIKDIISVKESGLAFFLSPIGERLAKKERRAERLGRKLFLRYMRGEQVCALPESEVPYAQESHISTARTWDVWQSFNAGRPYAEQIKPYNFFCYAHLFMRELYPVMPGGLYLPYTRRPEKCLGQLAYCLETDRWYRLEKCADTPYDRSPNTTDYAVMASLGGYFQVYGEHPERQFDGADGRPCSYSTYGLLARHPVHASGSYLYTGRDGLDMTPAAEEITQLGPAEQITYQTNDRSVENALHVLASEHLSELPYCQPRLAKRFGRLARSARLAFVLKNGLESITIRAAQEASCRRLGISPITQSEEVQSAIAAYLAKEQALQERFGTLFKSAPVREIGRIIGSLNMRALAAYRAGRLPGLPVLERWQARIDFEQVKDRLGELPAKDIGQRLHVRPAVAARIRAGEALGQPKHVRELVSMVKEREAAEEAAGEAEETRVLADAKRAGLREINAAILSLGGIGPHRDGNLREEYQTLPKHWRRRRGAPPDEMAAMLQANYPQLGVDDESDLYKLGAEYRQTTKAPPHCKPPRTVRGICRRAQN